MRLKFIRGIAASLTLLPPKGRRTGAMTIVLFLAMFSGAVVAQADDCAFRDGGYCVSGIASEIAKVLDKQIGPSPQPSPSRGEGEGGGVAFLNYYESLWNALVQAKMATEEERKAAFDVAGKAGGTKIGGVNLVVLSAKTLQLMVDKKVITKGEAQGVLNNARKDGGLPRPSGSQ